MSLSSSKQPAHSEVVARDPDNHEILEVDEKADVGLQYLVEHERITFTPSEERRVKWKLDLFLMPIQYPWTNSIFFFGYLIGQFPANYLLQRLPTGKFVAVNILIWGAFVMICGATQNFAGLATVRFFMGIFEACIMPCIIHIVGMFYRRSEQANRMSIWFSCQGLAIIVGGLVAYGIGHINSGIAEWRLIFLTFGGFTMLWSIIVWMFPPDLPLNARFFNEREKAIAIERLRSNRTGIKCYVFKWAQAVEAFRDPQVWLMCLWSGVGNILNIGGSFLPIIIKELGFTGLDTTLYTMPVGAVMFVAVILGGLACSSLKNYRTVLMFLLTLPTLVGTIMLQVLPQKDKWSRMAGAWLLLCVVASDAILLSLITSNVAGFSKKVTTTFLVYIVYCIGNIVSPQLFITSEAPDYKTGVRAMLVTASLVEVITIVLGVYYVWENKRRDRIL